MFHSFGGNFNYNTNFNAHFCQASMVLEEQRKVMYDPKIEYENKKVYISAKVYKMIILSGLGTFYVVGKPSHERNYSNKLNLMY